MLIVLVGESGSGKSSIAKALINNHNYNPIISITTRPKREGEIDGKDYKFVSDEEYDELDKKEALILKGEYRKWRYAVKKEDIDLNNKTNQVVILTPKGLREVKELAQDTGFDFLSFYVNVLRRQRFIKLLERGDDVEEAYRRNLSDVGQFDGIEGEVDYSLMNGHYNKSPEELAIEIIKKNKERKN